MGDDKDMNEDSVRIALNELETTIINQTRDRRAKTSIATHFDIKREQLGLPIEGASRFL